MEHVFIIHGDTYSSWRAPSFGKLLYGARGKFTILSFYPVDHWYEYPPNSMRYFSFPHPKGMHTNFESFKYCFIGKTGEKA